MPGNQASPEREELELKVSYMVKRSQGKSTLGAVNFKKRVFVLSPTKLTYYDGTFEVRGVLVALSYTCHELCTFTHILSGGSCRSV